MRITVDASVVVKWFFREQLSDEARLLLSGRFDLHAPGLLLAEVANTIWKKARRSAGAVDARSRLDELAELPQIVSLHHDDGLVVRAAHLGLALDHPVYDCLYLACGEATDSLVVTADRTLVGKAAEASVSAETAWLGDPRTAERIR